MDDLMFEGLLLAQAGGQPGGVQAFLPLILILAVFYFLLVRPQQKRAKEHQAMVDNLKRGDQVVTSGGLYGRLVEVSEGVVTLEVATNVMVKFQRSQIGELARDDKKEGKG